MPFDYDHEPASPGLTTVQLGVIARQVLGSWKLWTGLLLLTAAGAWGVMRLTEASLDRRTEAALKKLEEKNSSELKAVSERISKQLNEQIVAEFKDARIRATVEQVASERGTELLTNAVWGSLQTFREGLKQAQAQLSKATNELAGLSNAMNEAQRAVMQMAATASDEPAYLGLVDQAVTQRSNNYVLTLFFRPTSNKPMDLVELVAGTYRQTAKILGFTARNVEQMEPAVFNEIGDAARLQFTVTRTDVPIIVEIELSAATVVKLVGDLLEDEFTFPVAIDKMQIPFGVK